MTYAQPTPTRRLLRTAALLLCAMAVGRSQQQITAVRFWSLGTTTRIAIETDGPVSYRAQRLSDPDRLFFDLPNTVPREQRHLVQVIPVGDELVKQIRVALTRPRVTRVVLDLTGPADFSASQLANPDRLMIELRRPAPPAAAGQKAVEPLPDPPRLEAPALGPPETVARLIAPAARIPPPAAEMPTRRSEPAASLAKPPVSAPAPGPPAIASSAQRDSQGSRSLIRALGLKVGRVVLDPGHGGHDTGSIGPTGLREKDLVLDVALRLGRLIEQRMGSEVIYTRTDDSYVPLEARTELANQSGADLFLSIHANSSRLRSAAGSETFYLNFTTDAGALEVAARENAPSARTIHELQDLVLKIAQKEKIQESREFAGRIQKALYRHLRPPAGKNRGVKKAPFVVLIGARMPSVLVEIAFLSNPREERLLKQPEYRERLAEALYRGLFDYASTLSHFQLAQRSDE